MWGAIIGAASSVASGLLGSITAARAAKKAQRRIGMAQAENRNWYDRRYNEDATQRADAVSLLTRMQDEYRNRSRAAAGSAAVMGASEETVAAQKAANAQAAAQTAADITSKAESRKDAIEGQYLATKNNLANQANGVDAARAQTIGSATGKAVNALGKAGMAADEYLSEVGTNGNSAEVASDAPATTEAATPVASDGTYIDNPAETGSNPYDWDDPRNSGRNSWG